MGFQWFRQKVLGGRDKEDTIRESNRMNESDSDNFSTNMGEAMTASTYKRWMRGIQHKTSAGHFVHTGGSGSRINDKAVTSQQTGRPDY